ncbi:TPA: hypothetical protein ACXYK5_002272 [Legionella pneumophila]|nr:hypothetical protein [Legionella sp.]
MLARIEQLTEIDGILDLVVEFPDNQEAIIQLSPKSSRKEMKFIDIIYLKKRGVFKNKTKLNDNEKCL